MKLLIVASVPIHLHTFWRPYARFFRAKGWLVDGGAANIAAWQPSLKGDFDNLVELPFLRDPFRSLHKLPSQFFILRRIRQLTANYDIVHVNTPMAAFITRLAWRNKKRPYIVYTAHGFHFFKGNHSKFDFLYYLLEKVASKWTDLILTMNEEDYEAACSFKTSPVKLIPGIGIDLSVYTQSAVRQVRNQLGLGKHDRLIVSVAELIQRKGHVDILAAMEKLPTTVHLALVGNGRLEAKLLKKVKDRNLSDRVHFVGFQQDVSAWLAEADVTVLCSRHEGLPRCIMESMSVGTPVIASDVRGSRDLLKTGAGFLYPPGNIDKLIEQLTFVLNPSNRHYIDYSTKFAKKEILKYEQSVLLDIHEMLYQQITHNPKENV